MSNLNKLDTPDLAPLVSYFNEQNDDFLRVIEDLSHAVYMMHHLKREDFPDFEIVNVCATLHELERTLMKVHKSKVAALEELRLSA